MQKKIELVLAIKIRLQVLGLAFPRYRALESVSMAWSGGSYCLRGTRRPKSLRVKNGALV